MDTLHEALFKAMLNEGWFTDSDGDVESPTGYFGYVVNERGEFGGDFDGVYDAFRDVIDAYAEDELEPNNSGKWLDQNFYGVWSAYIDSNGIIHIHKHGDYVRTPGVAVLGLELTGPVRDAMQTFRNRSDEYQEWQGN